MSPLARLADGAVLGYQIFIRPLLPAVCRFAPSCSEYARESLRIHGFVRGTGFAARRIVRCHPFHPGGYDPPPPPRRRPGDTRI